MAATYNTEPYFDDFDATKNHVRILFKPGVAVQARELTQLQTAIQEQIKSIGGFLFKNEQLVSGGVSNLIEADWIDISASEIPDATLLENRKITGQNSGAIGAVIHAISNHQTDTHRVFFSYVNGKQFTSGDEIIDLSTDSIGSGAYSGSFGTSNIFTIERSVFYVNGFFVVSEADKVVVGNGYTTDSAKLGFKVVEDIVTYQDDESLLDNALGSPNYAAPGADRIQVKLELVSIAYDPVADAATENMVPDTTDNFIELGRVVSGNLISKNTTQTLGSIEDVLARRTFDESGDYTVKPFTATVASHIENNPEKLSIKVSPGKAYVKGYEFETTQTLTLDLPKARDTLEIQNRATGIDVGDYFIISAISGQTFDFTSNQTVNLRNVSNSVIGTAICNWIQYHSVGKYKLYVSNVKMTGAINAITNIEKSGFIATLYTTDGVLFKAKKSSFVIPVGFSPVKRMIDINYTAQLMVETTAVSTTLLQPNAISQNLSYASETTTDYVVVNTTTDTIVSISSVTASNQSLSISGTFVAGNVYQIYTKVFVSSGEQRTKTLTSKTIYVANSTASQINLGIADVSKIKQIFGMHNVNTTTTPIDITHRYVLENGQRDYVYDYASIELKNGQKSVSTAEYNVLKIELEHFDHTGNGYVSVNSYANISYDDIPAYKNSQGEVISLRDAYDFRSVRTANTASTSSTLLDPLLTTDTGSTAYSAALKPVFGDQIVYDLEYYLGRTDKLVVTKEKRFDLIKGISSVEPETPADIPSAMTIYVINVPAYTFSPAQVQLQFVNNRRYTMKDIAKIDKRIDRLEYYTSMTLLEKQASDEVIPDSTGLEKFKSGILVDPFISFGVADVGSSEYSAAIDTLTKTLRPRFNSTNLEFKLAQSSNAAAVHGDIVTLPYGTTPFVTNTLATSWVNLMPYMVFEWNGEMKLSPATDTWTDKSAPVEVVTNLNGENDPYTIMVDDVVNPASIGTKWDEHRLIGRGVDVNDKSFVAVDKTLAKSGKDVIETTKTTEVVDVTTTTTDTYISTGLITEKSSVATITKDLGNKVVDATLVPYIRARTIDFAAMKMMPSTRLFAAFDNVDVTKYCFQYPFFTVVIPAANATLVRKKSSTVEQTVVLSSPTAGAFIKMAPNEPAFKRGDILEWQVNGTWLSNGLPITDIIPGSNTLESNEYGMIAGYFDIPSSDRLRFPTGERVFKLADTLGKQPRTIAETKYVASGLSMSIQRDVLATRVQSVELKPISKIRQDIAVEKEYKSDIRIEPKIVTVPCGSLNAGNGASGKFEYELDFGTDTGICGVNYDPTGIPDRYTIIWNGNTYSSGFVGYSEYDSELKRLSYPTTVKFDGNSYPTGSDTSLSLSSKGKLRFNKTEFFPTKAKLIVDAPIRGSLWRYKLVCPGSTDDLIDDNVLLNGQISAPQNVELSRGTFTVIGNNFQDGVLSRTTTTTSARRYFFPRRDTRFSSIFVERNSINADDGNAGELRHGLYQTWQPLNQYAVTLSVEPTTMFPRGTNLILKSINVIQSTINITSQPNAFSGEPFQLRTPRVSINGSEFSTLVLPLSFNVSDVLRFDCALQDDKPEWRNQTIPNGKFFDLTYSATIALRDQIDGNFYDTTVSDTTEFTHVTSNISITATESESWTPQEWVDPPMVIWVPPPWPAGRIDPIAQTFIVENHPEGLFIKSVDLYFRNTSKYYNDGVTVQIRPVVNGYPQSNEFLPFASTFKYVDEIHTSADTDEVKLATRFDFDTPIYLAADTEYAVVAIPTSTDFEIFTTTLGEFSLQNPNQRATTQPYLGSMFKSQNQRTWTAEQTQDILMRLHKCVFTSQNTPVVLTAAVPKEMSSSTAIDYDIFYADGEILDFASTNIDFAVKPSIESSTGVFSYDTKSYQYQIGSNMNLGSRRALNPSDGSSLMLECILSTKNSDISPVIDVNRLSMALIENDVNTNIRGEDQKRVYTLTHVTGTTTELIFKLDSGHVLEVDDRVYVLLNTKNNLSSIYTITAKTIDSITVTRVESTGVFAEVADTGTITRFGQCNSKYVSRTVTLKPDFYSDDLSVQFNANIPNGCDVIPMYRVTLPDDKDITDEVWHYMTIDYTSSAAVNGFREYKYRTTYIDAGEHYALPSKDLFQQFAVKLLIVQNNPAVVPLVKDLRVITLNA